MTKPLNREEIFSKIKSVDKKATYRVSWITDVINVTTRKSETISVTVVAEAPVRLNINYANMKSVIEKGELAARTKIVGGMKIVSRSREPWWKHVEGASSLCFHRDDVSLAEERRRWYLQLFASTRTNKDPVTGKFTHGSTRVTPTLKYVMMMGTPDEEVVTNPKHIKVLEKLRKQKDTPQEVWFKKLNSILAIEKINAKGGK